MTQTKMRWEEHDDCIEYIETEHEIFVGRPMGDLIVWEDIIKTVACVLHLFG